jgi:hypothetical protein
MPASNILLKQDGSSDLSRSLSRKIEYGKVRRSKRGRVPIARVFVTDEFRGLPNWDDLFVDFFNLKVCGLHPENWGRDSALYQQPFGHVQLTNSKVVLQRWSSISEPFKRTIKRTETANDFWLLYATDAVENRFLLLDLFGPNAHVDPHFQAYIRALDDQIVSPWLLGRVDFYEPPENLDA